ncbi:cobaltochelatase subunit CobN [Sphingobacterium suaedae]|uniref:Cobaltochelatase subunit CobN n=1 Tax=Sphingobacterium suaedae TaxID=1686402 RepID=A0ABW5KEY1_9SPHI
MMKNCLPILGFLLCWLFGNMPVHAQQQPSEKRIRIALLMSDNYSKPLAEAITLLNQKPGFAGQFDVVTAQGEAASVSQAALIVCYVHTPQTIQRYAQQIGAILARGDAVYAVGSTPEAANYKAWGMQFDRELDTYFENPSPENIARMVQLLCDRHFGTSFAPEAPIDFPDYGIVDWQTGALYQDPEIFRKVYRTSSPHAPWVALYGFRYEFVTQQYDYIKSYARALHEAGMNVMLFYGFPLEKAVHDFCLDAHGRSTIEVLVNFSSLPGSSPEKLAQTFAQLDVPVINGITLLQTESEWQSSTTGLSVAERSLALVRPEIMGQIQPTVVATQESIFDGQGHIYKQKTPLPGRIAHLAQKVKAWINLRYKTNADKRVTLIYYNGHPGKQNIGASYLNVLPKSIHRITAELEKAGYNLGGGRIAEAEIFQRVLSGGRNIGTWAPGELSRMVEEEQPVLVPVEQYKMWFADLHPRFQEQVIQKWGEPDSARIMVWTDSRQRRYFVLPQVKFGNLSLMPQPARGWEEDEEALFHDVSLPPHHQYIAFYLYMQRQQKPDALIHLGTHGTLEWLSGREAGLDADDAPDALLGAMINIYPYIMDNVGEGTQAKRRGGAIIIDHLTPPFQEAGLRPELRELAGAIHDYHVALEKSPLLAQAHLKAINRWVEETNVLRDLDHNGPIDKDDVQQLEHYLNELNEQQTPMGMHTFGISPSEEQARLTAIAMASRQKKLTVQDRDALTAEFYDRILQSGPAEIRALLDVLDGKFIEPSLGNDPIRNPDAIPTGKNFYAFDPSRMPSREIYAMGSKLAEQIIEHYLENNQGNYPDKIAVNLWSVETLRHEGIMESQILHLLGVRPTYDGFGKVNGLALIPRDSLQRPRVDVLVTPSGLYRDMFPHMMNLLDQAVALVYESPEQDNSIRAHVDALERELTDVGVRDTALRRRLAMVRLFGAATGTYGIGVDEAVQASDKWTDSQEVADVYFNRSGHLYGQGFWGTGPTELQKITGKELALSLFKKALSGTKAVVHSRSTHVYGVLDNDDFFQYLGGMTLAIKTLDGTEPDVIISNLTDPSIARQESLDKFIGREMHTRYLNPTWITEMLDEGYAGARMVGQITDNMWGWQATTDQAIRPDDWQAWHDVYVADKYGLDIQKRFAEADNTYAYQGMLARMLEVTRKGYWTPDADTRDRLIAAYLETVETTGLSCSDQVCGNDQLLTYIEEHIQDGKIAQNVMQRLHEQLGRIKNTGRYMDAPQGGMQPLGGPTAVDRAPSPTVKRTAMDQHSRKKAKEAETPALKGYKMEEKTLFQPMESTRPEAAFDWVWVFLLALIFSCGFLWHRSTR